MATWTFNLSDTSSFFQYQPYGDGPFETGWQAGFSGSGLSPTTDGLDIGVGASYHTTSAAGSNVSLQFFGTGIALLGSAGCPYSVSVDNTQVAIGNSPPGTLYSETNSLSASVHTIFLSPHPSSQEQSLNFTGAQLISPTASEVSSSSIDSQNYARVAYAGTWLNTTNSQIPNATNPQPYLLTNEAGASASLNFRGRAVSVNGATDDGSGTYQVELNGLNYTRNASSVWLNPNATLFFMGGIDSTQTTTIKLVNLVAGQNLSLNSVTIYDFQTNASASEPPSATQTDADVSSGHSIPSGAIAGIVVGVLALLASITLCAFLWRKRRAHMPIDRDRSTIAPYLQNTAQTLASAPSAQNVANPTLSAGQQQQSFAKPIVPAASDQQRPDVGAARGEVAESSSPREGAVNISSDRIEPHTSHPLIAPRLLPTHLVPEDVTDEARDIIIASPTRTRDGDRRSISQARRGRAASPPAHSTGHSLRSTAALNRLADAVANRLAQRFTLPSEEQSPPSYDDSHDS